MTRKIIIESDIRIIVKVFRLGRSDRILEYFYNLGAVAKETFVVEEYDLFNYITKNRGQLVRENEELLKKMKETKKLEVC